MTAMLDYMMEKNSHLMFLIDDRKDEKLVEMASDCDRLHMESTIRHIFTFTTSNKLKVMNKSRKKSYTQMDKLLSYVTKINNSQIL